VQGEATVDRGHAALRRTEARDEAADVKNGSAIAYLRASDRASRNPSPIVECERHHEDQDAGLTVTCAARRSTATYRAPVGDRRLYAEAQARPEPTT
jgi:hypothetical protein